MENGVFNGMKYVLQLPEGYREGEKYPTLLFLHGSGTRGEDIELLRSNCFFKLIKEHKDLPFVCIAPQCKKNSWFDEFESLKAFVQFVTEQDFVDTKRLYLIGNSMGGYGSWELAMCCPEYFAAVVPICGGGMYWNAGRLKHLPIWAFHGEKDRVVFVEESRKMVDAVNKRGGNARLTLYPEAEHDSWTETYKNRELMLWLLEQSK